MKNRYRILAPLLIILCTGFYFSSGTLNEFPSRIHAWAQSDRYALSLGFVRNHLNFFRPETYVMNHQFPGDWKVPSDKSITAVDFPVHDYIPALVMTVTGSRAPWIFRLYILLYSFAGLFFLARLSFLIGNDTLKTMFLLLLAATSPVFAYYQGGFLPTVPSLSNAVIGIYFYFRCREKNRSGDLYLSLLFLTLAALSRISFMVPLIAVTLLEGYYVIRKHLLPSFRLWTLALPYLALGAWFIYNSWLTRKYGSDFLNHIMPPRSMHEILELVKATLRNWGMEYFSKYQYALFLGILAGAILFLKRKTAGEAFAERPYLPLTALLFAGGLVFAILMLKQFPDHDYYFLDTFFLPVLLVVAFLLRLLPEIRGKDLRITCLVLMILAGAFLVKKTSLIESDRRATGYWDRNEAAILNFRGADQFLDSLGIGKEARVLVMDVRSPNIPFILMDRKGYVVMSPDSTNIQKAMGWNFDVAVFQQDYFLPEIWSACPEIPAELDKIADNGRIMVCRRAQKPQEKDLLTFFGLHDRSPVFETTLNFDSVTDPHWSILHPTELYAHSGTCAGCLAPDEEFGLSYKINSPALLQNRSRMLVCSGWFLQDSLNDCQAVVSIGQGNTRIFYQSVPLKNILKKKNTWENATFLYQLPKVEADSSQFAFYFWNPGKDRLYYDDLTLRLY